MLLAYHGAILPDRGILIGPSQTSFDVRRSFLPSVTVGHLSQIFCGTPDGRSGREALHQTMAGENDNPVDRLEAVLYFHGPPTFICWYLTALSMMKSVI